MSSFLKTFQRDIKKANVEQKQIFKKGSLILKTKKKEAEEIRKKAMKKFGETRKREGQNESDSGDEKQGRSSSEKVGFI